MDDGLTFDPASVTTSPIAEDADYAGVRVRFQGRLGNARIPMQIDIGFSDVVTPHPEKLWFPMLLDQPPAELMGYTRESVVAEKFEAMVKLGELNRRMKDFFDIWLLSGMFDFDGSQLAAAIHATFTRRATAIESEPVCFTDRFAQDRTKAAQWAAFRHRTHVRDVPDFPAVVLRVRDFLQPVATSFVEDSAFSQMWPSDGPWSGSANDLQSRRVTG